MQDSIITLVDDSTAKRVCLGVHARDAGTAVRRAVARARDCGHAKTHVTAVVAESIR
jgi:hypothetical protein